MIQQFFDNESDKDSTSILNGTPVNTGDNGNIASTNASIPKTLELTAENQDDEFFPAHGSENEAQNDTKNDAQKTSELESNGLNSQPVDTIPESGDVENKCLMFQNEEVDRYLTDLAYENINPNRLEPKFRLILDLYTSNSELKKAGRMSQAEKKSRKELFS
jgi:hypothetical protein